MWSFAKNVFKGLEDAVGKGWANLVTKNSTKYTTAATASRGGIVSASTLKAKYAFRGVFAVVGGTVAGWLAYLGITWTGKKMEDGTATLGFLTILAAVTAIGVGAIIVLRKK